MTGVMDQAGIWSGGGKRQGSGTNSGQNSDGNPDPDTDVRRVSFCRGGEGRVGW